MPEFATDSQTCVDVETVARQLLGYCCRNDWAGWDPYDALNSGIVMSFPFLQLKIPALILTQSLKRSPVNLRPLLRVPKAHNPKGIALCLSAIVRTPSLADGHGADLATMLTDKLLALRSPTSQYWCWGYSFPWRGRNMLVPKWAPNLVCTCFAATSMLDLFERSRDERYLHIAVSAAEYILADLYWSKGDLEAGFSYPLPSVRNQVHNANLLAAALLCRLQKWTGREEFLLPALRVARYSASKQRVDGSWPYGETPSQKWIDNFHTGYNLCALQSISCDAGTAEFQSCIQQGFEFYRSHFFREDGAAKYFHDRTYPIDIHCVAQSIITLLALKESRPENIELARSVFQWAIKHMWDKRGYFYFRVLPLGTIRTSYMRWSQAWMLRSLSELMSQSSEGRKELQSEDSTRLINVC